MTTDQYKQVLDDYLSTNKAAQENYDQLKQGYNFTDGIPKFRLFVKLAPGVSEERRDFIANGIRAYFHGDTTLLLDKLQAEKAIEGTITIFDAFVIIVGLISLVLAFFLLTISTT